MASQRALGEIRIILTIRLYGTGVVEELHGVARLAVRVARVAEQWTILQQALTPMEEWMDTAISNSSP